jgi:hypothetical protein
MLDLILVVTLAAVIAVASGAILLAARFWSGRRLEQEIHTRGALETIGNRTVPDSASWDTSAQAA